MMKRFLLVGAGFSCAVIGRELAKAGHSVTLVEQRDQALKKQVRTRSS